jgi:hypothetical protein
MRTLCRARFVLEPERDPGGPIEESYNDNQMQAPAAALGLGFADRVVVEDSPGNPSKGQYWLSLWRPLVAMLRPVTLRRVAIHDRCCLTGQR